jgi:hypothetical protein
MGAGVLAWPVLQWTGAAASLSSAVLLSKWLTPILCIVAASLAGALYGGVFQGAASDRRGGWLFGISYGFLLWMLGPIALVQTVLGRPLATGTAAMGMLAAHLIFGLGLGLLFRQAHALVRHGLEKRVADRAADAA